MNIGGMSNFSPLEINRGEIFELCRTPFLENSNNINGQDCASGTPREH